MSAKKTCSQSLATKALAADAKQGQIVETSAPELMACKCCKRRLDLELLKSSGYCHPCADLPMSRDHKKYITVLSACCNKWRRLCHFQDLPFSRQCKKCPRKYVYKNRQTRR